MESEIDSTNLMLVTERNGKVWIMNQPCVQLTHAQALNLAAYIVALTDPGRVTFDAILEAVLDA